MTLNSNGREFLRHGLNGSKDCVTFWGRQNDGCKDRRKIVLQNLGWIARFLARSFALWPLNVARVRPALLGTLAATVGILGTSFTSNASEWAIPCSPESSYVDTSESAIDPNICADWNPVFGIRGAGCCVKSGRTLASLKRSSRSRRGGASKASCSITRAKASFCDEMTPDQRVYWDGVLTGRLRDPLSYLALDIRKSAQQSFCSVNNGFLAYGLPVVPTDRNRIYLKSGERCLNFGTSRLVAMTEWLGKRVAEQYADPDYSGVRLVVGHLSAPRGGCITRPGGKRSHASHTSGRDIDLAFFNPRAKSASGTLFTRDFIPGTNWWLVREAFTNPFVCVKELFLDRKLIRKLGAYAAKQDPEGWKRLSPFIKHVKGHRDHHHFRVGDGSGEPGCLNETQEPDSESEWNELFDEWEDVKKSDPVEALLESEDSSDEEGFVDAPVDASAGIKKVLQATSLEEALNRRMDEEVVPGNGEE